MEIIAIFITSQQCLSLAEIENLLGQLSLIKGEYPRIALKVLAPCISMSVVQVRHRVPLNRVGDSWPCH